MGGGAEHPTQISRGSFSLTGRVSEIPILPGVAYSPVEQNRCVHSVKGVGSPAPVASPHALPRYAAERSSCASSSIP
jgi:hypothetical protein